MTNDLADGLTPTGSVQFQVDGSNYGQPIALDQNGQATISDSSLALGNHSISASYTPTGAVRSPSEGDATATIDPGDSGPATLATTIGIRPATGAIGVPQASDDVYITKLAAGAMINLGPADVANNLTIASGLSSQRRPAHGRGMLTDSASP